MESRSTPTTTLVTKPFEGLAQVTAKGKGMPNLPLTLLPFPFDQLPEKEIREITRETIPGLVRSLALSEDIRDKG